ncbi:MAG TPA: hypothetical protein VGI10_14380 [Polyangiaceae bacterium]|jgi:hypothetical protein
MPFKVNQDGEIQCDSAAEAVELSRLIAASKTAASLEKSLNGHSYAQATPHSVVTRIAQAFPEFLKALPKPQLLLLEHVRLYNAITLEELREALGLKGKFQISGLIAGLNKNIKKAGLDESDVLLRDEAGSGKNRVVTYRPGGLLEATSEEVFASK